MVSSGGKYSYESVLFIIVHSNSYCIYPFKFPIIVGLCLFFRKKNVEKWWGIALLESVLKKILKRRKSDIISRKLCDFGGFFDDYKFRKKKKKGEGAHT